MSMTNYNNTISAANPQAMNSGRWIHRNELKVGMFVREMDCRWEDTPFKLEGFVVDNLNLLHDVQELAQYVRVEACEEVA